jgi:hypothetical protein
MYFKDKWDVTSSTLSILEDDTRELAERLETAVYSVLSMVQDSISEYLRTPWPSTNGREMAMPGVRTDAEMVYLWYGGEKEPVISMPPIRIAEIIDTGGTSSPGA